MTLLRAGSGINRLGDLLSDKGIVEPRHTYDPGSAVVRFDVAPAFRRRCSAGVPTRAFPLLQALTRVRTPALQNGPRAV